MLFFLHCACFLCLFFLLYFQHKIQQFYLSRIVPANIVNNLIKSCDPTRFLSLVVIVLNIYL